MLISIQEKEGQRLYFNGYTDKLTFKGLGSGALTGTNRVPKFTENQEKGKRIQSYIDARRIMGEIIDAVKYNDIENVTSVTLKLNE